MKTQLQPNRWSCFLTCCCNLIDMDLEVAYELLGHDGSAILDKGVKEPLGRRGFTESELLTQLLLPLNLVWYNLNYGVVQYEHFCITLPEFDIVKANPELGMIICGNRKSDGKGHAFACARKTLDIGYVHDTSHGLVKYSQMLSTFTITDSFHIVKKQV